jgi:hypothetical protein
MKGWMNERIEWMNEGSSKRNNDETNEWMYEWINERINEWMK